MKFENTGLEMNEKREVVPRVGNVQEPIDVRCFWNLGLRRVGMNGFGGFEDFWVRAVSLVLGFLIWPMMDLLEWGT